MTEDILFGDLEKLEAKIDRLFQAAVSDSTPKCVQCTPTSHDNNIFS